MPTNIVLQVFRLKISIYQLINPNDLQLDNNKLIGEFMKLLLELNTHETSLISGGKGDCGCFRRETKEDNDRCGRRLSLFEYVVDSDCVNARTGIFLYEDAKQESLSACRHICCEIKGGFSYYYGYYAYRNLHRKLC